MGSFRTMEGYNRQEKRTLTHAMEDYLEMICRCAQETGYVRVQQVADMLHVKPSSVTKMAAQLKSLGYVEYEPYGYVRPTPKGTEEGAYLLYRHAVLHQFLCMVNGTVDELEQVEQIEHFFTRKTVQNIEKMMQHCARCLRDLHASGVDVPNNRS